MLEAAEREVRELLARSSSHYERARRVVPGGATRSRFWWPMPIYAMRGEGPYLYDLDGRRYVDCNLGFGPLILGHRHERVERAIADQLARGVQLGAPGTGEYELGRRVVSAVPGAERVIFLSSGTEATLSAIRLARAATGRSKVAKFEGGWHGAQDYLLHSYLRAAGEPDRPELVVESAGVPPEVTGTVVALPFNSDRAPELIREHAEDLACVIVEPVQGGGGGIPAERGFLQAVRDTCRDRGVVLIADEVITGFRLAPGGAAGGIYGVSPDLTVFGKIVGGGFPVGAVCGRAELIDRVLAGPAGLSVVAGGTHAANPMTTAAGIAQLDVLLENPQIYAELAATGDHLRAELTALVDRLGVAAQVTGIGSLWGFHFTGVRPVSVRDLKDGNEAAATILAALLLQEGVLVSAPMHLGFLSSAHAASDIDQVVAAHTKALERMAAGGVF